MTIRTIPSSEQIPTFKVNIEEQFVRYKELLRQELPEKPINMKFPKRPWDNIHSVG